MTGPWQSARDLDADVAPCQRCSKDVVLAHDEPCPHGFVACPECGWEAVCRDCKHNAELEEWAAHLGTPHGLEIEPQTNEQVAADMAADMRKRRAELERIREVDREAWIKYREWLEGKEAGEHDD